MQLESSLASWVCWPARTKFTSQPKESYFLRQKLADSSEAQSSGSLNDCYCCCCRLPMGRCMQANLPKLSSDNRLSDSCRPNVSNNTRQRNRNNYYKAKFYRNPNLIFYSEKQLVRLFSHITILLLLMCLTPSGYLRVVGVDADLSSFERQYYPTTNKTGHCK